MRRGWCLLLWLTIATTVNAQVITRQNLSTILGFENNTRAGVFPAGWGGSPDSIYTDNQVVHSGNYSVRIERTASSSSTASTITTGIPLDFAGSRIEWRGFLKWEGVAGAVALWMRVDGQTPGSLAFATLETQNLSGTRDWAQYSISVPNIAAGRQLVFGFFLIGTGKAWADDLELLVDGRPVSQAALRVPNGDHEFDQGSRIQLTSLSAVQSKNLATLAKVWGFLKYHHSVITAGSRHWDYDLFRIIPQVLDAADAASANTAISAWVNLLGAVQPCAPCASLETSDLYLAPHLDWIHDTSLLGAQLSQTLETVYQNRRPARQFYVSLLNVSNPQFDNEFTYPTIQFPDSGFQLLALFRFWNIVEYFYPNRDIMSDDPAHIADYWDTVLQEFIPRIGLAANVVAYQQELMKFIAKINDTHANLWSSLAVRPPIGPCQLPVDVRFVEGQAIVLRDISKTATAGSTLLPGDIIEELDGVRVSDLINQWRSIYADSNEAARLRDMAVYLTRGTCGAAGVVVRRGTTRMALDSTRVPPASLNFSATYTHDRPGDAFQMLTNDIAYLKLSAVKTAESANYVQAAASTKGLVIDIRNYPSEFVVFTLGQLLVSTLTPFARFTAGDTTNPGAFHWNAPISLTPQQPHYSGKVVILIDEVTQSQAEYTTMAFRTAPGAIVIGSTTAGADGNVSTVLVPGGFSSYISGLGVFYPDRRPTQRVGIIPDIEVTPTIEGIRAGRDELLEEAIRQIKGETNPIVNFGLNEQAAVSMATTGTSPTMATGYATIQANSGNTPSGLAILGFRQKNILVSETTVPASTLIRNGRTYAEISSTVNIGVAFANPGTQTAMISFYFSDSSGNFGSGTKMIPAKGQFAAFLNEAPFNGRALANGTFTFSSSQPLAVTALRGLLNTRGEFLITTLPVIDLDAQANAAGLMFPHFADGAGWTTQIVLANATDSSLTGSIQFRDPAGAPTSVSIGNQTATSFAYSIPARSSQKFTTSGTAGPASVGSIRVVPNTNNSSPFGVSIFSLRSAGTIVSEAGVPTVPEGSAFRLYAQATGDFKAAAIGSIQTGVAIVNTSANSAVVTVELMKLDGTSTGLKGTLSVPANGQIATFLSQIPAFSSLQVPYQGTLRISSPASISVIGFRARYNERRDFLMTTIMPVDEASPQGTTPLYFPHIADSGGYTTQFVLFSALPGQSNGTLSLTDPFGSPMDVMVR